MILSTRAFLRRPRVTSRLPFPRLDIHRSSSYCYYSTTTSKNPPASTTTTTYDTTTNATARTTPTTTIDKKSSTPQKWSVDPSEVESCFGCGSRFQETRPFHAGYLPGMDDRKQAFLLGMPFDRYRTEFLQQVKPAELEYRRKKAHEQAIFSALQSSVDPLELAKDVVSSSSSGTMTTTTEQSPPPPSPSKQDKNKDALLQSMSATNQHTHQHHQDFVTRAGADAKLVCARCYSLTYQNSLPSGLQQLPYPISEMEAYHVKESQDALRAIRKQLESRENAFVVALCDITDFPHSLYLPLLQSIGKRASILVVANKCDLLPEKSNLERIRYWMQSYLRKTLHVEGVVDTHLISLKKRTGLDGVLSSIVKYRGPMDDIYLVGNTNVGKSTLMNYLLREFHGPDYRKSTTSWLPGTTMNTVSVPLKRMPAIRDFILDAKSELIAQKQRAMMKSLRAAGSSPAKSVSSSPSPAKSSVASVAPYLLRANTSSEISKILAGNLLDTPGVINTDSLLHLLTPEEIKMCLADKPIVPMTYQVKPGQTIWLAGLGRVDYVQGKDPVMATVFTGNKLPIHISSIEKAEALWALHGGVRSKDWDEILNYTVADLKKLTAEQVRVKRKNQNKDMWSGAILAPPYFTDPKQHLLARRLGSDERFAGLLADRMALYPAFQRAARVQLTHAEPPPAMVVPLKSFAKNLMMSSGDFVFAGIGWISITGNFAVDKGRAGTFEAYSPGGKGVLFRGESMLPFDVMRRGKKHKGMSLNRYRSCPPEQLQKMVRIEQEYWTAVKKRLDTGATQ